MTLHGTPAPEIIPTPELTEGYYAIEKLVDLNFNDLLTDCGYDYQSIHSVNKSLQLLGTNPVISSSPYTGEYFAFKDANDGLECQLHTISATEWSHGGYHFITADINQSDDSLFTDEYTTGEVLLLLDKGEVISPKNVFLDAMFTRCGISSWQQKTWPTFLGENIGKYSETKWNDRNATIEFIYPAKYPNAIPLQTYEMHLRNFERIDLNGNIYHVFMRMMKNPKHAIRSNLIARQPFNIPNILGRFTEPEFNSQYVH